MKRYAIVGLGSRSRLYTEALLTDYRAQGALVGYCDVNQTRMDYDNRLYGERLGAPPSRPTRQATSHACSTSGRSTP